MMCAHKRLRACLRTYARAYACAVKKEKVVCEKIVCEKIVAVKKEKYAKK